MAVRDWLRKLKDAAYDAENLVDEFRIEALRRKVENQDGMLKKVGNLFHPLVFRFKMANKVQELRERFNDIAKERNDFHFREGVIEIPPPISTTRETCSYVIESEFVIVVKHRVLACVGKQHDEGCKHSKRK
ncbi:hypothetical protein MRB53_035712 [Persea americana]|uniref:Uncharacterized protein n=1 Tax=Persea americana TaxID=3435 RepID=A0ACC2K5F0_PERAE|nr:hypothetical protein MRB53_035712 [Persea americana]